jgi:drug/metabolite transporter (DMT)-like permease
MAARGHDDRAAGGGIEHAPSLFDAPHSPHAPLVLASLLAVYFAWGSTYLAIRVALTALPPFLLAGLRAIVAGLILLGWARWLGFGAVSQRAIRNAAVVGVLLLAGGNGLVTFAEQFVSSSLTAAIVSSGSIWIVVLLALLGEAPTRGETAGVVLGFAGVLVLAAEGEVRASPIGAAALIGATLSWSLGSVLTRRLVLPAGPLMVAVELLAGGAVMTAGGLIAGERIVAERLTFDGVAAWFYLIVVGSLIGFSAFTFLMRNVRPALATSFVYVNPVVAVALGVVVGGEHVSRTGYAGTAVCVLGLAVVTLAARARR